MNAFTLKESKFLVMHTWRFENEAVETQGIVVIPSDVKEMLLVTDHLSFAGLSHQNLVSILELRKIYYEGRKWKKLAQK
jgi:hypothetical protein